MCPHCGRDAPIVYRGPVASCTACGGLRSLLSSPSVNLAGKPSRVGGAVASAVGAFLLLLGLSLALGLGLLFYALFSALVALAVALPMALVVLVVGLVLLTSGRSLRRSGADAARATHDQALVELAAHRGAITAADAARVLGVSVQDADAMLTGLAKREPERMAVDVDEHGVVWYRAASPSGEPFEARLRVAGTTRVDAGPPQSEDSVEGAGPEPTEMRR
jgi:hypothetical protein